MSGDSRHLRHDVFTKEMRSRVMARIRSKNTECELRLRSSLRTLGLRNYRLHSRRVLGTPDIVFPRQRIVVFCDSDFWHGKKSIPVTNRAYWEKKLLRNMQRDHYVNRELKKQGWRVLRFSESEILRNSNRCANKVLKIVETLEDARDREAR